MGVQRRTVPHFNGLIELYLDLQAQGRDSTFTFRHALVKKAILEGKRATVPSDLLLAVYTGCPIDIAPHESGNRTT